MALIALELSDAGIMAAGGEPPRLLALDGRDTISRGFALPEGKKILWGNNAARQAHLFPYKIQHHFWDQLSNDPLREPVAGAENQAELAFGHLERLWHALKTHGNEMIVAVPTYYSRRQMGLFLGMAQELDLPLKGFVPQALAVVPDPVGASNLLFLDLHLHRAEVTLLSQTEQLSCKKTLTLDEQGLLQLHRAWVDALAEEFVQTTRIDPLHEAGSEQALYDRIEGILQHLKHHFSMTVNLKLGHGVHSVTITRDLFVAKAASFFNGVRRLIHLLLEKDDDQSNDTVLLLTERMASVPGVGDLLTNLPRSKIVALGKGAAALNLLRRKKEFDRGRSATGAHFFSSRPWQFPATHTATAQAAPTASRRPTHILWGELAYPIMPDPLFIVETPDVANSPGLYVTRHQPRDRHWTIRVQLQEQQVVLSIHEESRVTLNGERIKGAHSGSLGQSFQVGDLAEKMRLIACMEENEVPAL